jgi:EmrB/QacA subfamily drug resistance transporter
MSQERTRSTQQATSPAASSGSSSGIVLLTAAGATFLAFLDATVVNVAFPALEADFPSRSVADLSWVLTIYGIMFAALLTPAGRLADVLGRRNLFAISMLIFTAASLWAALSPELGSLVAARFVQGIGAAGMIPAGLGLVLGHSAPEKRMLAVSAWAGAGSLAAAAGPSLGGLLIDVFDWRSVFYINVPLGLLLVYLTYAKIPNDVPHDRKVPDILGTLMVIVGISLAVLGLTKGADWGWTDAKTLGSLVGGLVLLALAIFRSTRHEAPAVETTLWRSKVFAGTNLTSLFVGAAMFAWMLLGPVFLTFAWGYSVLKAGLAISPGALFSAIAAVIIGRRVTGSGHRTVVVVFSLLFALTAVWFYALMGSEPQYLTLFLPANLVSGFAVGAIVTSLSGAAAASLPPQKFAAGTGLLITARQLGGALGIAAMAAIMTARAAQGIDAMLEVGLFCAIAAAAGAVAGFTLADNKQPVAAAGAGAGATPQTAK